MNKLMGLGKIGTCTIGRRKFRWTFEATNEGVSCFEQIFVKVSQRPALLMKFVALKGAEIIQDGWESLPSSITINAWDIPNNDSRIQHLKADTGIIRLYDGCGCEMEKWILHDIKMSCAAEHIDADNCDVVWEVNYEKSTYESTFDFSPVSYTNPYPVK